MFDDLNEYKREQIVPADPMGTQVKRNLRNAQDSISAIRLVLFRL